MLTARLIALRAIVTLPVFAAFLGGLGWKWQ